MQKSSRIIRTYLIVAGLYTLSASLIWGVNTLFLLNAGLDIFGVFVANSVFTGSMAIFEIPTGVLADTRGRRLSVLLSVAVLVVGTLGYVAVARLNGGLFGFGLMSVVLGLGYTFFSGAGEAWLVDALEASGYSGGLDQIFARSSMVTRVAMLVGTVGGGLLGTLDLSIPYLARAASLIVLLVVAYLAIHDVGFTARPITLTALPTEMGRVARASITYGWRQPSIRLLILGSFILDILLQWGFHAWQPYFLQLLGRNLPWVAGLIAALVSLATIAGNSLVEWFARFCGRRTTLLIWAAAVHAAAAVVVGLAGNFWLAVASYLLVMAALGVWEPVKQAYVHQMVPSKQRATIISFESLFRSGGSTLGQVGLGRMAQTGSYASGYIVGGLITVLAVPAVAVLRRRDDEEDFIVGAAGRRGACAAQGIPSVSGLDTTALRLETADA